MSALAFAHLARAEARMKVEHTTAARERGRQAHEEAVAELERLQTAETSWIERAAKGLQAAFAVGHRTPPQLVADPKAQHALMSARVNVRARATALEQLEADQKAARDALAAAEAAVAEAADAQLQAEAEALAARVEEALAEAARLGAELRAYQPNELHTPLSQLQLSQSVASVRVRHMLERLDRMETDGGLALNIRLCDLSWSGAGMPPAGSNFLATRRAALVAEGVPAPPDDEPAQERAA
jgi:hypothetical protein